MTDNISVTTAYLTGLITYSLFYGVYSVLFLGSLYVIFYKKKNNPIGSVIVGGTVLQFVLITVCYGLRWGRIYAAFIANGDNPDGPLLFLSQLDDWMEVSSSAIWAMTSALGDVLFIYRLFIVWDRRFVPCLVPFGLLIGSLVSTVGLLVVLDEPFTTVYASRLSPWVWSFLSFNLAQNLLVTLLIVARIWRVNWQSAKFGGGGSLWPVMVILLESGALYSSSMLLFLVTYACKNNASMIMTDMVMPLMGISFNLIIVRVGLGFSKSDATLQTRGRTTIKFARPATSTGPHPMHEIDGSAVEQGVTDMVTANTIGYE